VVVVSGSSVTAAVAMAVVWLMMFRLTVVVIGSFRWNKADMRLAVRH